MITKEKATEMARLEIESYVPPANDRFILLEDETIENDEGWLFFYTSEKWYTTKDFQYAIAGNLPIFVEKKSGILSLRDFPKVTRSSNGE